MRTSLVLGLTSTQLSSRARRHFYSVTWTIFWPESPLLIPRGPLYRTVSVPGLAPDPSAWVSCQDICGKCRKSEYCFGHNNDDFRGFRRATDPWQVTGRGSWPRTSHECQPQCCARELREFFQFCKNRHVIRTADSGDPLRSTAPLNRPPSSTFHSLVSLSLAMTLSSIIYCNEGVLASGDWTSSSTEQNNNTNPALASCVLF